MTTQLEKFESVLDRFTDANGAGVLARAGQPIVFIGDNEDGSFSRQLNLRAVDYLDFGEPDQVTILVRPGDRMNG